MAVLIPKAIILVLPSPFSRTDATSNDYALIPARENAMTALQPSFMLPPNFLFPPQGQIKPGVVLRDGKNGVPDPSLPLHLGARSWPAATRDNVMCIYATEGRGTPYTENPTWCKDTHRLATLGVMVPVWSPPSGGAAPRITHRSGTSIATPVAAGIAACVLSFVWRSQAIYLSNTTSEDARTSERFQRAMKELQKARGMGEIFKRMTDGNNSTEYHFVHPWKLFDRQTTTTTLIENIVNCLVPRRL